VLDEPIPRLRERLGVGLDLAHSAAEGRDGQADLACHVGVRPTSHRTLAPRREGSVDLAQRSQRIGEEGGRELGLQQELLDLGVDPGVGLRAPGVPIGQRTATTEQSVHPAHGPIDSSARIRVPLRGGPGVEGGGDALGPAQLAPPRNDEPSRERNQEQCPVQGSGVLLDGLRETDLFSRSEEPMGTDFAQVGPEQARLIADVGSEALDPSRHALGVLSEARGAGRHPEAARVGNVREDRPGNRLSSRAETP
jgi:hypothetical protein